ncbi:melatonin receptor type 1B-B-like [Amphiura filiformis]|uniref:melatonin receptor type 1B-B-like n=1 Tax=Amphiura filiformis TaxID=82378 RepID=UPI003B21C1C8
MLGYLVVVIAVAALGIFGNILVLATLVIDEKLRVLNNLFIGNLAVADLFIAGVIHPFTAVGIIGGREYLFFQDNGDISYLCEFLASFCIISCSASVLSIGAVAVNRYVYICHNRSYSKIYTPRTIPLMVVGIWIVGVLIDLPTYLGFGDHVFHERISSCFFDPLHTEYKIFFVIIGIFSPVALAVYCYVRILALVYMSKRRLQKRMRTSSSVSIKSGNTAVKAADVRLLKTIAAMGILAVIIYTPFAITLLVDHGQISRTVWMFSNGLMHSFSCINWLIYAATNNRIRDGFALVYRKHLCRRLCFKQSRDIDSTPADATGDGTSGRFSGTAATSSGLATDDCKYPGIIDTYDLPKLDQKTPGDDGFSGPIETSFGKSENRDEDRDNLGTEDVHGVLNKMPDKSGDDTGTDNPILSGTDNPNLLSSEGLSYQGPVAV